jgi:uncharacterized protein (TIGR02270 family)
MSTTSGAPIRPFGFRPEEISSLVNHAVIRAHATEAAFLWTLRTRASTAPHYRLTNLRKLDMRVIAHLEGLKVAGDEGWTAAARGLDELDDAALFVATYLAFFRRDPRQMNHALQLALTEPALEGALRSALQWLAPDTVRPALDRLCGSSHAAHRRIGLAALAAHRLPIERDLVRASSDPDPALRAMAFQAIAETKRDEFMTLARQGIDDPDPVCRFWAASAVALNGAPSGAVIALDAGLAMDPPASLVIDIAFRTGDPEWARGTIRAWAAVRDRTRLAIQAIAALGDPVTVPWLVERMADPEHARAAGEAFSTITGVDLKYADLTDEAPEDEAVRPDDAGSPVPNPALVREWWRAHRSEFQSGSRYLAGDIVTAAAMKRTLRDGYQRQRLAAAIELARLEKAPIFPVAARADWQQRWLAS